MSGSVCIKLLFFSKSRELLDGLGSDTMCVDSGRTLTAQQLLHLLIARYPR